MILGYRTWLRADTLEKFWVDCFNLKVTDNGEMLTPVVANMKNLVAFLTKRDKALFKQQIVQCTDERFCAIATFKRQLTLLEDVGEVERNYLFRTSHFWSKTLGTKKSSADTFRGAAIWVPKVLGWHITFKHIGRMVAMTKLARDPGISLVNAAKYLGVQVRTLMVYHRKDKERVEKAARILSRYHDPEKEEGGVKAEPSIANTTSAPPKEEKASHSATLPPKREVVCVSLSPVKAEKKRKDRTPSAPSEKIVIDLTAEEEYATFPLTQLSEKEPSIYVLNEKESIVYEREMYHSRAWAAPATPAAAAAKAPRPHWVKICPAFHLLLPKLHVKSNP